MPIERRYADWRPVAVRRMPTRWIGLLVGALAGIVATVLWGSTEQMIYWAALALGTYVSNRVAARRLEALRDEGDERQFGATLRLKRETAYGFDEGLVAFEDGYLVYMGRRCAFSLGAGDVRIEKRSKSELQFVFQGPGEEHEAHLELSGNHGFLTAVEQWKVADRRSPESVLPPARPDASVSPLAMAGMNALPILAVGIAFLAARSKHSSETIFTLVFGLILVGVALLSAFGQFRALGRIARREARRPSLAERGQRWRTARTKRRNAARQPLSTSPHTPSPLTAAPTAAEDETAHPLPRVQGA